MTKEDAIKIVLFTVPVVFAAGGIWWQVQSAVDKMGDLHTEVHEHIRDAGHDVSVERISSLEEFQDEMVVEQRQQGENIAAICQATNARCK